MLNSENLMKYGETGHINRVQTRIVEAYSENHWILKMKALNPNFNLNLPPSSK